MYIINTMKLKNGTIKYSRNQSGFTLVEMLVVISIAVIIMAIALPPLHRWLIRYKVNQETATIYNALTEMRFRSLAHKNGKLWGASFNTNSMSTFSWSDKNFDGQVSSDEETPLATYSLDYTLAAGFPTLIWFDSRGIIRQSNGIQGNATITISSSNLPAGLDAYNCIAISANRIREGKLSSGACNVS